MAFTGLTVACGFAVGDNSDNKSHQPIMAKAVWSEEPASGVATTNSAPGETGMDPIMRIYAAADSWISVGPNPDASSGPRLLVPALTVYDIYVSAGDKLEWVAA